MGVEEVRTQPVSLHPGPVQEKLVNFVRKDMFLKGHSLRAQSRCEPDGVGELHIPVVVSLDEQDR